MSIESSGSEFEIWQPLDWPKGTVHSIERAQELALRQVGQLGKSLGHVEEYELKDLKLAQKEGYTHILHLPYENSDNLKAKYGMFFFALTPYFRYVEKLARRHGIKDLKHLYDHYYAFKNVDDAEQLGHYLAEAQHQVNLEFETVEAVNVSDVKSLT
jgi:C-terminal processing protease CtpA/Prc